MKRTIQLVAVAAIALLAGCKKVKNLANINVDIPYKQQVSIPDAGYAYGTPLPGGGVTLPFPAIPIATNSKQYIQQYHTSSDKIVKVDLKSLSLEILAPAGQNFDFLDNVQLYISAPGQSEMLIASQYSVPKGQTVLNLATETGVNLKNYFLADTMYLRMSTHINAVPPSGTQLQVASVFHMLANPLE